MESRSGDEEVKKNAQSILGQLWQIRLATNDLFKNSREKSLALTKIDEARMWIAEINE